MDSCRAVKLRPNAARRIITLLTAIKTTPRRSAISNQNNKARLQLLEKREELLEKVFDEAKAKLGEVTKDEKKYSELLKNLVLQVRP